MANFHIEIDIQQRSHHGEIVCGDVFCSNNEVEDNRKIIVMSDGMGHGVKANVLAAMTSRMALHYSKLGASPQDIARNVVKVLPKTSDDKDSYATFVIIEIDSDGKVVIVNYESPPVVVMRGDSLFETKIVQQEILPMRHAGASLTVQEFHARKEDRIIFYSDGVPQSGLGSNRLPMGWSDDGSKNFVLKQVDRSLNMSANKLARKILNQATLNDSYMPKDDITCGVVYFRQPREILLVTGPPFYKARDTEFALRVKNFDGPKIICGGTTSEIISRELDVKIKAETHLADPALPPQWNMDGFDLVTEGILTIGTVEEILENYETDTRLHDSPAEEIVKKLLLHDIIHFVVGTRINWAHQAPDQPMELEIRKFVIKRVVRLLRHKFFKEVKVDFV